MSLSAFGSVLAMVVPTELDGLFSPSRFHGSGSQEIRSILAIEKQQPSDSQGSSHVAQWTSELFACCCDDGEVPEYEFDDAGRECFGGARTRTGSPASRNGRYFQSLLQFTTITPSPSHSQQSFRTAALLRHARGDVLVL